ncbi:MAG: 4Fe-4S binding protein [Chloroflexota bacterium]|nr:MAG: 4Fe-4S binding protein [Chloroflexota bacterium]
MSKQKSTTLTKELPESPRRPEGTCPAQTGPSLTGDPREPNKLNLLANPYIRRLLRWRGFQFAIQLPNVLVYLLVIVTGFYGTQTSTQNFATVVTWIIWWAAIVFTFVFVGRLWCLMCPFSAMAEWLQRFSLWAVRKESFGLNWKWPLKLRNLYLATAMFLLLTWVDNRYGLVGSPLYTAYFVLVILAAAIVVALLFERRTFCRYVCPIGGLIGTYALFASAELRVADRQICRGHKEKNCLLGSGTVGYGCPVRAYPGDIDSNYSCTLCTECIKTCPKNNIALNVRPFGHDLVNLNEKRLGLDMSILAVVLLGLPTYQTIIMITPWEGWMQAIQQFTGLSSQIVFSLVFLVSTLAIPVGLFLGTTFVTRLLAHGHDVTHRRLFINFAYAFVPIGLMMHLAHNVKHLLGEGQTIIPVLSDPFGWGWNLFGTSKLQLSSLFSTDVLTAMQFGLLLLGQGFAVYVSYRIGHRLFGGRGKAFLRGLAPILVLAITWSVFNLWVLSQPLMERH